VGPSRPSWARANRSGGGERVLDESKVILLVEDNPDDEALTLRAFAKNNIGNRIVVVRDGAEALDWLFRRGTHAERDEPDPQVVLLDLKLPKVDGLEVLRQLRANPKTKFLPVVIFTSSKEESDLLRGYELRANSYIRKPVDFARFVEYVREIGMYWLVLNEPPPGQR
jgi:two-component system response regulator